MSKFNAIRPYYDSEVNDALISMLSHPMLKAMMHFTFPELTETEWKNRLKRTHSIRDFQINFAYQSIKKILQTSSEGLTTSGFEKLCPNTSYLFISNHRDIVLDTSLLNVSLHDNGLIMTASAIGDNLVQKEIILKLSRLNRNFVIQRNLPPRELLQSSKLVSEYIQQLLLKENRSVWVAQKEGRTKDGNDATHQGVLKMIAMASNENAPLTYFKKLKIVPVAISYEYDPTDILKIPQLLTEAKNNVYKKAKNEDFVNLISGIIGQKKRIHISVGNILDKELNNTVNETNKTKQIQAITQMIDTEILNLYKLWPTNYIAYDILYSTSRFSHFYTEKEKDFFIRRLEMRLKKEKNIAKDSFLAMYANPVKNKHNINAIN